MAALNLVIRAFDPPGPDRVNPIPHGVFRITHTWGGGRFCPSPCNTAILKDMDLKFGMLK